MALKIIEENKFDRAIVSFAQQYADSFPESELAQDPLLSPQLKRARLKEELVDGVQMPELTEQLERAVQIIQNEGVKILSFDQYAHLIEAFSEARIRLEQLDLSKSSLKNNWGTLLQLNDGDTIASLYKMGLVKYEQEQFFDSLALFSLLTALNPEESENWYRMGIAAHNCDKLDLALNAYHTAWELNPDLIGARLFAAQCHVKLHENQAAKELCDEVQVLMAKKEPDALWSALLGNMQMFLQAA